MDLSDVLLLVHIVAAMAWLGGGFLASVFASRMKTADPEHRIGFARLMQKASVGLFLPSAVIVLAMGTWMVIDSDVYEFDQMWISIGFGIVLITGAMAPFFFKPTIGRSIEAMQAGDAAKAGALMQRLGMGSKLALIAEFIAVWAMVVKPGL